MTLLFITNFLSAPSTLFLRRRSCFLQLFLQLFDAFPQLLLARDDVEVLPEVRVIVHRSIHEDGVGAYALVSGELLDVCGVDVAGRHLEPSVQEGRTAEPAFLLLDLEVQVATHMVHVVSVAPLPVGKRVLGSLWVDFDVFALLLHQRGFLDVVGVDVEAYLHQCQCLCIEVYLSPIEVLLGGLGGAEVDDVGTPVFHPGDVGEEIDTFVARRLGIQEDGQVLHDVECQAATDTATDFGYQAVLFRTEAEPVVLQLFHLVADVSGIDPRLVYLEDTLRQVHQLLVVVRAFAVEGGEIGRGDGVVLLASFVHVLQQGDGVSHADDDLVQGNDVGSQTDDGLVGRERGEVYFLLLIADVRAYQPGGLQRVGDVDVEPSVLVADGSP